MLSARPAEDTHKPSMMKVYCDTNTLFHNIKRHEEQLKVQKQLAALEQLLERQQAGQLSMFRSRVDLRELEGTEDQNLREKLKADYEALEPIPNDERVYGSHIVADPYGGVIANPLVSDVQDEALCRKLVDCGLESRDAEHITQALCNDCDVFLTRDEDTIIKPHREWIEARFPKLKVRLPSELLAELP